MRGCGINRPVNRRRWINGKDSRKQPGSTLQREPITFLLRQVVSTVFDIPAKCRVICIFAKGSNQRSIFPFRIYPANN